MITNWKRYCQPIDKWQYRYRSHKFRFIDRKLPFTCKLVAIMPLEPFNIYFGGINVQHHNGSFSHQTQFGRGIKTLAIYYYARLIFAKRIFLSGTHFLLLYFQLPYWLRPFHQWFNLHFLVHSYKARNLVVFVSEMWFYPLLRNIRDKESCNECNKPVSQNVQMLKV